MADATLILNRLRRSRQNVLQQVEAVLDRAIATGRSAIETAKHIGQYIAPFYANRRAETGRILRAARVGIAPAYPAGSGLASFPARFIATAEIAQAHGATVKRLVEQTPGWFLKWVLSPSHKDEDFCDQNATSDQGYGPGIYPGDATPIYPEHPGCLCTLVPIRLGG